MKVLVVSPHPDDEAIGVGGTIRNHVNAGDTVDVVFLTSGERGCPGIAPEQAGPMREREAEVASVILGSKVLEFVHQPDGEVRISDGLRNGIAELIHHYDLVYVTHEKESHTDHRMAGILVRQAAQQLDSPPEILVYEVWTPLQRVDRVSDISPVIENKTKAIAAHSSQISRQAFDEAAFGLSRYRGIMNGRCEYAEVFARMRLKGNEDMKIGIALLTYSPTVDHPRASYARTTLTSTLQNIDPGPGNQLHVHIADDGSDPLHTAALVDIAQKYGYTPSITNAERGGYGKSYNLMMQALHTSCDLIMPLEDDWELTKPLKLEYLAKALDDSDNGIRSIRLGYLGITQDLNGTVVFTNGMTYLRLDPASPEPHVFCGHPRLETVEYQRDVGAWPEGLRAGDTEWEVTHRWPARTGVAWPLDLQIPASQDWGAMYAHIGSISFNQDIPEGATKSA